LLTRTLIGAALALALVGARPAAATRGLAVDSLDPTCQPCQDFYQFANGGWLARNEIPAAFPSWGTASKLREQNNEALHQILEAAAQNTSAPVGSNEQKIGAFYASCMDTAAIERAGAKPIAEDLARIEKIKDLRALQTVVARLHTYGVGAMFGFGSVPDFKQSSNVIAIVGQGGLSLPDRDYYTKDDEKSKQLRAAFVAHVGRMLMLLGDDEAKAQAGAQVVMNIETKLAAHSRGSVELRDLAAQYHKQPVAELQKTTPHFIWADYFKEVGAPKFNELNVSHPEFFTALDKLLTEVPLKDWQTYLRWQLLAAAAPVLSSKFEAESFDFNSRTLQGTKEMQPRWRRCVAATDGNLGEALGEAYVKKNFTPAAKARMQQLVNNLLAALREDLTTLDWMSDETRTRAIAKLDAFVTKIGYPDKWRDYTTLKVDRGLYADNIVRAAQFQNDFQLRQIGRPVDRTLWGMTPPTVNAYNSLLRNEIVFPAGILQPPFFNADADDALNYGAIGSVIGHEITHGFDDKGRQFDPQGNLTDWWAAADLQKYMTRAACVEQQFAAFKVEDGLNMNGKLVLGESIADLGGLSIAYAAFQKSLAGKERPAEIDGFTPEQRFFIGYGQVWGRNYRPEAARLQAQTDPHPLAKFRVNGPLANLPQFAAAFNCKQGDPMVRAESERCQIW
jgi:putative endopeptidase